MQPQKIEEELKKGTTTVALKCKDCVVLVADMRASMGTLVASKTAKKIHQLNDYSAMTIAGLVSDAQYIVDIIQAQIRLFELDRKRRPKISMIANLVKNMLYGQYRSLFPFFVQLIVGGWDKTGAHIYSFDMAGSLSEEDWFASGSGSPMAFGVLEAMYEEGLSKKKGIELALTALKSAIKRDTATGDGIKAVVIDSDGFKELEKDEIKQYGGEI
ncbi:MAG: archaeal proteasome endopeptidase complex subunit beta [Candidatus Heimdallarchaeota archaeon]|nr:archaeal proteasome endopeptidase complex subunit beta [Candidatus Heimdallarchaeota archaeon]